MGGAWARGRGRPEAAAGGGAGCVSMRSACPAPAAAPSRVAASHPCECGSNRRNSSKTLGVIENREPTECSEEGTGVGTGAATSVPSGAV